MAGSDLDELLAVLDLRTAEAPDTFFGPHPRRNPIRTFGGQMMAQAFVAGSRTVSPKLPPSALSVHFIAGGDPARTSNCGWSGCGTNGGSPIAASTSCRTVRCSRRR